MRGSGSQSIMGIWNYGGIFLGGGNYHDNGGRLVC